MNRYGKQAILACAALLVCAAAPLQGAEYYVSTNGLDTADGLSWGSAWRSVSHAVVQAEAASTINISNGVYTCAAEILIDKTLTLVGVNGAALTTVRRDGTGGEHRVFRITAAGSVLDGLTIRDGTAANQSSDIYSGAGVHMTVAATLRNCVFRNNNAHRNALKGGAVYMTAGLVENCEFYDNAVHSAGGAVYLSGSSTVRNCILRGNSCGSGTGGGAHVNGSSAVLENCLIVGSWVGTRYAGTERALSVLQADGRFNRYNYANYGGGVYNDQGTVRNCTIIANRSFAHVATPGHGLYMKGASAKAINCIVFYNGTSLYASDRNDVTLAGGAVTYSCIGTETPGVGNTSRDPDFSDWQNGDYALRPGSPCLDSGTNIVEITVDLAGNDRRIDGSGDSAAQQDMGAYETLAANSGALRANAVASANEAFDTLEVELTAHAAGADAEDVSFYWDLDNDGLTDATAAQVTRTYGPGLHAVALTVSNATEGATVVMPACIRVAPSTIYVATNGANVFPYHTLGNAAAGTTAGFNAAVSAACVTPATTSRIEVAAGNYPLSGHIVLDKAVTLQSARGTSATVLRRAASGTALPLHRVLNVLQPGAVADGFTICNGYMTYHEASGSGVLVMSGGMLANCIVSNNWANHNSSQGGGGVLVFNGGTMRNCLVARNDNYRWGGGVAALDNVANARVENCTIVSNRVLNTTWLGGGTYLGTYVNCVIAGNVNIGGNVLYADRSGGTYTYTLSPGLASGTGNVDGVPTFVNAAGGDYRLTSTSPGINAGLNQAWMDGATDLAGAPRLVGRTVDIGAYECQSLPGTMIFVR